MGLSNEGRLTEAQRAGYRAKGKALMARLTATATGEDWRDSHPWLIVGESGRVYRRHSNYPLAEWTLRLIQWIASRGKLWEYGLSELRADSNWHIEDARLNRRGAPEVADGAA